MRKDSQEIEMSSYANRQSVRQLFQTSDADDNGSDSEQQIRKVQEKEKDKAHDQLMKQKNKRDFLVNAGFAFEITDYFKFEEKQNQLREKTFFKYLSQQHYLSWLVLLYSVVSSAMIPPWLMSIKATKLLRISWRCFLQLFILIPFVLYQRRSANEKVISQYEMSHIFNPKNIKKIFILSLTGTFYFTTILTTIEWTYISHSMVLGSLTNFFLSLERTFNNTNGQMEKGGEIIIFLGICFVIYDSISLDVSKATSFEWNVYNYYYLTRQWWQRVLGDFGAIAIAYCLSQFSRYTSDIKEYYPPYLSMFLNNIFTCIFVLFSSYFFNGVTFDFDETWGVFALFTDAYFTNFLYMCILLGMGVFISFVMVSKMFPDPVVPAMAMTFEPIISTVLFHAVGVQTLPGSYACLGYFFIIPGIIIILVGNCLFTRSKDIDETHLKAPILKKEAESVNSQKQKNK